MNITLHKSAQVIAKCFGKYGTAVYASAIALIAIKAMADTLKG